MHCIANLQLCHSPRGELDASWPASTLPVAPVTMGANESSLEGDAMAQEADDSSSSLSATGAASAYDAPPEPPEAEAPAEAATSPGDEPPELLCPITLSMMGDPVVANDGHSYERAAIATWLATHDTSPQTREPASCGGDDFREILTGKTKRNRHRHAW